jgi:hypothetical protein
MRGGGYGPIDQFVDEEAVANFTALQALVGAIRNVRAEYNVELGRKVLPRSPLCGLITRGVKERTSGSRAACVRLWPHCTDRQWWRHRATRTTRCRAV